MLTVSIEDHKVLVLSKVDLPFDVIEFDLNDPNSYDEIKNKILERQRPHPLARCAIHNGDSVPRDMRQIQ
jgi:hypothetical protein